MNIEDGLLLAAKARALQTGRTVSGIVRDLLSREVGWSGAGDAGPMDDSAILPVLKSYSAGRVPRRRAMEAAGLRPDQYQDFVGAMERLGVAWPAVDRAAAEREADAVVEAIAGGRHED